MCAARTLSIVSIFRKKHAPKLAYFYSLIWVEIRSVVRRWMFMLGYCDYDDSVVLKHDGIIILHKPILPKDLVSNILYLVSTGKLDP